MTPAEYRDKVLKPLVGDFFREPGSLPRLFAAVITSYHMMDYIRVSAGLDRKEEDKVRSAIARRTPNFMPLYFVAIAQKHVRVEQKKFRDAGIDLNVNCVEEHPAPWMWTDDEPVRWSSDGGPLIWTTSFQVEVDGRDVNLHSALRSVSECFDRHLAEIEAELGHRC